MRKLSPGGGEDLQWGMSLRLPFPLLTVKWRLELLSHLFFRITVRMKLDDVCDIFEDSHKNNNSNDHKDNIY